MNKTDKEKESFINDMVALMKSVMNKETCHKLTLEESKTLVLAVMTYLKVAEFFFHDFLKPMISGFKLRYSIEDSLKDISNFIHAIFCDNGRWSRFLSFRYETTLMGWMHMHINQIIIKESKTEGFFRFNPKRTPSNTRLRIKHLPKEEREMVVDLVESPQQYQLLSLIYVEKKGETEICDLMHMDSERFVKACKQADYVLKKMLIKQEYLLTWRCYEGGRTATVNLVNLALSDKNSRNVDIDNGEAFDDAALTVGYEAPSMSDSYFEERYLGLSTQEQNEMHTKSIIDEMEWGSTMEKNIFIERYIYDKEPVTLARNLGCKRSYIDVAFSRAKKDFESYISKRQACDNKNSKAMSTIICHSIAYDAIDMPKNTSAMTAICKELSINEMSMCAKIAKIYSGKDYEGEKLYKLLHASGIVNHVDSVELKLVDFSSTVSESHNYNANKKHFTPAQHYPLSSVYVARHINKDVANEIYNFSGSSRFKWNDSEGHRLTASIGLSFMKYCIMRFG